MPDSADRPVTGSAALRQYRAGRRMYRKELALWLSACMNGFGSSATLAELIDMRPDAEEYDLPPDQARLVERDLAEGLLRRAQNDGWIR